VAGLSRPATPISRQKSVAQILSEHKSDAQAVKRVAQLPTVRPRTANETIVAGGRFGTDRDGYAALPRYGKRWPGAGTGR
jgi:hypothetical protein